LPVTLIGMEMQPVARTALSDAVFGQLADAILTGSIAAGDSLPAERELAESFAVNRHAVREALKRLQQANLVQIVQGGNTRVLDWRSNAGLDVLVQLTRTGVLPAAAVLHDVFVMRMTVGADAARQCAERASAADLERVMAAADAYPAQPDHVDDLVKADLAFWDAVIDGSGNIAYRLALNTLVAGLAEIDVAEITGLVTEYADRSSHLALAETIAMRRGAHAYAQATSLLSRIVVLLEMKQEG
jgi:GntR family transcriptional repressor for pyruvate dehydrogenase complex